jgi:hypothetical protein
MATRRTTRVEVPIPSTPSTTTNMKSPQVDTPLGGSPFLPTALETVLLAIYPTTLVLGSLFSTLHPDTRFATYLPDSQSYDPRNAPSYFADDRKELPSVDLFLHEAEFILFDSLVFQNFDSSSLRLSFPCRIEVRA